MGLIASNRFARVRARLDTWYWRARYWWFDTEAGARFRVVLYVSALLIVCTQLVRMVHAAVRIAMGG